MWVHYLCSANAFFALSIFQTQNGLDYYLKHCPSASIKAINEDMLAASKHKKEWAE